MKRIKDTSQNFIKPSIIELIPANQNCNRFRTLEHTLTIGHETRGRVNTPPRHLTLVLERAILSYGQLVPDHSLVLFGGAIRGTRANLSSLVL